MKYFFYKIINIFKIFIIKPIIKTIDYIPYIIDIDLDPLNIV
jgi:hypothetical protein